MFIVVSFSALISSIHSALKLKKRIVCGHLDYFQYLINTNNAAINNFIYRYFHNIGGVSSA